MMGIRRTLSKVRRRFRGKRPRPCILMYHRIAPLRHDPWGLAVDPATFDEQMRYLREHRRPMAVDEMVDGLQRGTLPPTAVAVTFDDAYLDNLVYAKPSLVRHGIPGTVFVPTAYIGRTVPFWWDEVGSMVLDNPGPCAAMQECGTDRVFLDWGPLEKADADPSWRGWEAPNTKRQTAYVALWSRMQKMTEEQREPVLQSLRSKFRIEADPLSLPMSHGQLSEMVAGDLVQVGAHTVHHASLSDRSLDEGRQEIRESKVQCEIFAQRPVTGFAYPYGNMTPEICREVERAGFRYACAAEAGYLDSAEPDYFTLPRLPAPDAGGNEFAALLMG